MGAEYLHCYHGKHRDSLERDWRSKVEEQELSISMVGCQSISVVSMVTMEIDTLISMNDSEREGWRSER